MNLNQKARVLIVLIIVLAAFGATYAAKARLGQIVYTRSNPAINRCDIDYRTRTLLPGGAFVTFTYATTIAGGTCPDKRNIYIGE